MAIWLQVTKLIEHVTCTVKWFLITLSHVSWLHSRVSNLFNQNQNQTRIRHQVWRCYEEHSFGASRIVELKRWKGVYANGFVLGCFLTIFIKGKVTNTFNNRCILRHITTTVLVQLKLSQFTVTNNTFVGYRVLHIVTTVQGRLISQISSEVERLHKKIIGWVDDVHLDIPMHTVEFTVKGITWPTVTVDNLVMTKQFIIQLLSKGIIRISRPACQFTCITITFHPLRRETNSGSSWEWQRLDIKVLRSGTWRQRDNGRVCEETHTRRCNPVNRTQHLLRLHHRLQGVITWINLLTHPALRETLRGVKENV